MIFRSIVMAAVLVSSLTAETRHATGTFEVKISPQSSDETPEDKTRGRMLMDKQLHGDIEGIGKGQMLTAMAEGGSAVYVAIERITGALHGRKGSFVLHHTGISTSAGQQLTITVVPDSGTGELSGIKGTMVITITGKQHFYDFEYALP